MNTAKHIGTFILTIVVAFLAMEGIESLLDRAHPPRLSVRQPCAIVDRTEDPSGKFVEYRFLCAEAAR
jgi:hypothetical protein